MTFDERKEYVKRFNAKHTLLGTKARLKYAEDTDEIAQMDFLTETKGNDIVIKIDDYVTTAYIRGIYRCGTAIIEYNGERLKTLRISLKCAFKIKIVANKNKVIQKILFRGSSDTSSIDLSEIDTSSLQDMSRMFEGCSALEHINFGNTRITGVEDLSYMFFGCLSLKQLDLSVLDTKNVFDMEHMFYACEELEKLNLTSFNVQKGVNTYRMFSGCKRLVQLEIEQASLARIFEEETAFSSCDKKFIEEIERRIKQNDSE